jgi:hypothetical protein
MTINKDFQAENWWATVSGAGTSDAVVATWADDYTRHRSGALEYTSPEALIGRKDGVVITEVVAIKDIEKYSYDFIFLATDITKTIDLDPTLGVRGDITKVIITIPDWTNTVTTDITVLNEDSKEVWEYLALAQNDEYDITLADNKCTLLGNTGEQIKLTLSGQPGSGGGTAVVTIYVEG